MEGDAISYTGKKKSTKALVIEFIKPIGPNQTFTADDIMDKYGLSHTRRNALRCALSDLVGDDSIFRVGGNRSGIYAKVYYTRVKSKEEKIVGDLQDIIIKLKSVVNEFMDEL